MELRAASQQLKASIKLAGPARKRVLRELQLKWHPDKQYGSAANRERAADLTVQINEAFAIAKRNAKVRGEDF